ncbi:MAG: cytochrome P450 [Pseudomonadota bacterium]
MDSDAALAEAFDIQNLPDGFAEDPYPTYRALLEHAPLKRFADGSVMLSRWEDLDRVYRDTATFTSDKKIEFGAKYGVGSPLFEHHTTSLVFNDPPLHTRVRRIMAGAMAPRAISAMEPGVIALVDELLDRMAAKGEVDLIEDYAMLIPIEVIGNLFDIPKAERGPLRDWSLAILGALEPVISAEQEAAGNRAVVEFRAYLGDLAARRRAKPGDIQTDVLTRLMQEDEEGGLTETELLQNCIFILNAGHETTTNLIGNALYELWANPEEKARLMGNGMLLPLTVEEALRFQSSNQLGNRMAAADCEFHGETVEAGTRLHLAIGAANRDRRQFADPDRFDAGRKPNKHLAFGGGPHTCAGFVLARMEGRIAISRFLERFPDYEIIAGAERSGRVRFRGYSRSPARLCP